MAAGAAARRRPTCSAIIVPWLNPTSASARRRKIAPRELGIEKLLERGPAAFTPVQRSFGSRNVSGNHCASDRRLAARLRRVRRHEGGMRQESLPGAADVDEVVAVRAVAMQEHDELARRPGARLEPRTVELSGHSRRSLVLSD